MFVELIGLWYIVLVIFGDLLFYIWVEIMDVCFELVGCIFKLMGDVVIVVDEVYGFWFFDNCDLLGFVDGIENLSGLIVIKVIMIGDED